MGSDPQNHRATTTLEIAASTIDPSTAALHCPITSSMTKRIAEIGALNAAARPAAAPTGAKMRRRALESPSLRLMREATPAPICNEGSSGPSEWPPPIARAESRNLPHTVRKEIYPLWIYIAAFVWLMPLPLTSGKTKRVNTATISPTTVGTTSSLTCRGPGDDPSKSTLSQSIAMRKDTTSSPEMMPIKMDSRRKIRSSRPGMACIESGNIGGLEGLSFALMMASPFQGGRLRQQKQQGIVSCGRRTMRAGLNFSVVDQL